MVPRYTGALVCKATGFLRAQNLPAPFFLWITRLRKKCFEKMNLQANSVLDFRQKIRCTPLKGLLCAVKS